MSPAQQYRRARRRAKASSLFFGLNMGFMVIEAIYAGLAINMGLAPWLTGVAFLCHFFGLFIPMLKEMLGFADEYGEVEQAFIREHVDPSAPQQAQVYSPNDGQDAFQGEAPISVGPGLWAFVLGFSLFAADLVWTFAV